MHPGVLFERSLRGVTGTISAAPILPGLWRIKGETLGGLTPALTFAKDQSAARYVCYWPLLIVDKKFANVGNGKGRCI